MMRMAFEILVFRGCKQALGTVPELLYCTTIAQFSLFQKMNSRYHTVLGLENTREILSCNPRPGIFQKITAQLQYRTVL
jgi:hypothetical protein